MAEPRPLDRSRALKGIDLRHAALYLLERFGPLSIADLLRALDDAGFVVGGAQPNKTLGDALRWETEKGRAIRLARGLYALRRLTRTTAWRIRTRWAAARGEAPEEVREHCKGPAPARPTGTGWYGGRWRRKSPPTSTPLTHHPNRRARPWGRFARHSAAGCSAPNPPTVIHWDLPVTRSRRSRLAGP